MTEAAVSFAGNLTDNPELRHTEGGIARAMVRVAVSGRREQEPSFFTVVVWRDQAEHAAQSLSRGSRVVVVGRLQQRSWTAEDSSARSIVEVVAEELGPSMRTRAMRHKAWLAWRSPPRLSRWRWVRPEDAGMGAVPHRWAKAASPRSRWGCRRR